MKKQQQVFSLLIICSSLLILGCSENSKTKSEINVPKGSKPANKLTCEKLFKKGYGKNAFVKLTDFYLTKEFVYQTDRIAALKEDWKKVFILAVPKGSRLHERETSGPGIVGGVILPDEAGVLIISDKIKNSDELNKIVEEGSLEGMVIGKGNSVLDKSIQQRLNTMFYEYPFTKIWVIEHGKQP